MAHSLVGAKKAFLRQGSLGSPSAFELIDLGDERQNFWGDLDVGSTEQGHEYSHKCPQHKSMAGF